MVEAYLVPGPEIKSFEEATIYAISVKSTMDRQFIGSIAVEKILIPRRLGTPEKVLYKCNNDLTFPTLTVFTVNFLNKRSILIF